MVSLHKYKKSFFTLLEVLVVLFLTSLGMTLTGVKVKELYQEQRFFSQVQQVTAHLAMAQDLMLIMNTDVEVKIVRDPKENELQIWLEVEAPLQDAMAKLVERKLFLPAIHSFSFEDVEDHRHRHRGGNDSELTLYFFLGKMSEGKLTLLGSKEEKYQFLLTGFPYPIEGKALSKEEVSLRSRGKIDKEEESALLYPEPVYQELYENPNASPQ